MSNVFLFILKILENSVLNKRFIFIKEILTQFISYVLLYITSSLFLYFFYLCIKKTLSDLKYTFSCIFIRSMSLFMILVVRLAPLSIPSLHIVRDHHEIY